MTDQARKQLLARLQKVLADHPRLLLLVGIWLVSLGAGFSILPPPQIGGEGLSLVLLGRLLLTALLGLMIAPLTRWQDRRHVLPWGLVTVTVLLLGAACIISYQQLEERWTVRYQHKMLLAGSELMPDARDFRKERPEATDEELLFQARGKTEEVWTKESIDRNRRKLSALYLPAVPLVALCLVAVAQVILCVKRPTVIAAAAGVDRKSAAAVTTTASLGQLGGEIFISYAREDSDFCLRLAQDLKDEGLEAWIDQLDIPAGAQWDTEVESALRRAETALVVLSPHSVTSRNVLDEASLAIDEGYLVVPVLYRPCEVPMRLRRLQHVDFSGDYAAALVELLTKKLHSATREAAGGSDSPSRPT